MNVKKVVDQLGKIRLLKADLKKQEDDLAESLKKLGNGSYAGHTFAALVYPGSRSSVDIEALCKEFEISKEDLEDFTKNTPFTCVKTTLIS